MNNFKHLSFAIGNNEFNGYLTHKVYVGGFLEQLAAKNKFGVHLIGPISRRLRRNMSLNRVRLEKKRLIGNISHGFWHIPQFELC